MKYCISFSEEKSLINICQQDSYSFKEIELLINEIYRDPRYKPTYNFLIDIRKIRHTPIVQEMYELAELISLKGKSFKGNTAIVTENEVHHYLVKLAMMMVLSKTGIKNRVFQHPEQALNWLNECSVKKKAND